MQSLEPVSLPAVGSQSDAGAGGRLGWPGRTTLTRGLENSTRNEVRRSMFLSTKGRNCDSAVIGKKSLNDMK